jgi:hypothetical protein
MGRVIILSSNEWQSSFYSTSRSDFTTGVSVIGTSTETTFMTGGSATTITICSNRNTTSTRWPGGRAAGVEFQSVSHADAEAPAPTSGSLQRSDLGTQDPSSVGGPAPVVEQPKPPPRTDKIELTIDSLQNYELLKPIRVIVESLGDKVFVAEAPELNVSTSGTSVGGALILLKDHISTIYEGYTSKKNLDSERARHFKTFETYIGRPRRNWM